MSETSTLPMFPLGMVLLPTMVVPIHVFEPRYRQMTNDCLMAIGSSGWSSSSGAAKWAVCDVRTDAGTAARIIEAQEFPDGRWGLVAGGIRRIQVCRWLEDDPYPERKSKTGPTAGLMTTAPTSPLGWVPVMAVWRRVLALQSELGAPGPGQTSRCPTILRPQSGSSPLCLQWDHWTVNGY